MHRSKGFTLVELLVVLVIVGVLVSIFMSGTSAIKAKSRDSKRLTDIAQIQLALEMYYRQNGSYPICSNGNENSTCVTTGTYCTSLPAGSGSSRSFYPELAEKLKPYIGQLPLDPLNSGSHAYWYARCWEKSRTGSNDVQRIQTNSRGSYIIGARLETYNRTGPYVPVLWSPSDLNYLVGNEPY